MSENREPDRGAGATMTARPSGRPPRGHRAGAALEQLYGQPAGWMADAVCAQADPDAWFPEPYVVPTLAKRVCSSCPVIMDCLEFALATDQRFGVWGGLSEREREPLRRARRHDVDQEKT